MKLLKICAAALGVSIATIAMLAIVSKNVHGDTSVPVYSAGLSSASNPAVYDVTSATTTALDTGILDVSPYTCLIVWTTNSSGAAPAGQWFIVDDSGASLQQYFVTPAGTNNSWGWGAGCIGPAASGNGSNQTALPRRIRIVTGAPAAGTVRYRIEGRRAF